MTKSNKENEIVTWLKTEQGLLQRRFKDKITKLKRGYDHRGVWIIVTCTCGYNFRTCFYIPKNGKCPQCNKLFTRAKL
jgi:predicted Zn-ribbon and HTH transcriptional regulator